MMVFWYTSYIRTEGHMGRARDKLFRTCKTACNVRVVDDLTVMQQETTTYPKSLPTKARNTHGGAFRTRRMNRLI